MALAMAVSSPVAFISCRPLLKPSVSKGLASRRSELVGSGATSLAAAVAVPRIVVAPLVIQPVASGRRCELTGKKSNNAMKISYSHRRSKKLQFPNLQYKRLWWEAGKRFVKLRVCTQALKTIDRKGLDAMAKEAGINLRDY